MPIQLAIIRHSIGKILAKELRYLCHAHAWLCAVIVVIEPLIGKLHHRGSVAFGFVLKSLRKPKKQFEAASLVVLEVQLSEVFVPIFLVEVLLGLDDDSFWVDVVAHE